MQDAPRASHAIKTLPWRFSRRSTGPLHAGLLRRDGTAKPALAAFRDAAAAWLVGAAPTLIAAPASQDGDPLTGVQRVDARHTLRIRRRVSHGRLVVDVDIIAGTRTTPVRVSYTAIRNGRVVGRAARTVKIRKGVAHVAFRLSRRARRAPTLRITATQQSARATSVLRRGGAGAGAG